MHISQPLIKQTMKKTRPRGSSDDYDKDKVFRWDSVKERFSHNDGRLETRVMHQRDTKHNACVKSMSASLDKVNNSLIPTARSLCSCSGDEVENVEIAKQEDHLGTTRSHEPYIDSTAQEGRGDEEGDPEDKDSLGPRRVEELQAEEVAQDTLFFSCTKCNVNFEEKRHFHRHMMYHLGGHNQVNSEDVSQPFVCGECGRLFCDSNSLMSHIIIHQDRLENLMVEIKGLKNTEFKDPGRTAAVQCPQCVSGCNCPKILVQRARTHDNLKHYYFCEECNYMTLTQQALEAHLRVTHLNAQQPRYRDMTRTNDAAEKLDRVQFQDKMCLFSGRDKVVLERHQRSHCSNYTKVSDRLKVARSKPNLLTTVFGGKAHFPHCKEGVHYIHNSKENTVNSAQFAHNRLSPSLWRVDRHGKLLLQPVETLHVATDLTCVEEDTENNVWKAFGSSKQLANCPAAPDLLLSAQNLKLDQMFCQASRGLQKQEKQNAPPTRKMSTPLLKTIDNMNDDISARLSQRLKKEFPDRELERGSSNFCSDDTSGATGSILRSSENESNPYARRYFRKRQQSFPVKDQSPQSVLKDQDNADEDCSDIEQLIIKEEYIENTVCDGSSPESPCMSPSDAFDVSPTPAVEHKPCPYCPAMFESGVGLSNHVRGHLHRVGLSYNSRHMISPEQVTSRDRQPRIRRRIPCGLRKMRKAVKPEGQGEHSCPLCWGWFDTKTGLSNHVRGHLKRMGGSVGSASSKSPLCVLNQLLRDREEHLNMLQVLNKKSQFSSSPCFVPEKITSTNGLDLKSSAIPLEIHYEIRSPHAILDSCLVPKQKAETFSARNKLQVDAQRGTTEAPSSTLVELLQVRQELTAGYSQQAYAPRTKDYMEETQVTSVGANRANGERDSNEVCFECNSPLPRLPAHLPVYTHRKRIGIIGAAGYDYKQKKPRPRPGLKKKMFPALNADIYTLTCRFCDLVFQGPLSIQEDWIKHLQRHLLHTAVPHSGTGMVEVLGLHHKIQISMFGERPDLE